jgi:hypothetical protein
VHHGKRQQNCISALIRINDEEIACDGKLGETDGKIVFASAMHQSYPQAKMM